MLANKSVLFGVAKACLLFWVSSNAAGQPAVNRLDGAKELWHACIAKRVAVLDDGISPASDIATAVQTDCAAEHEVFLSRMTLSPAMRAQFAAGRLEDTRQVATVLVIKIRALRREQARNRTE